MGKTGKKKLPHTVDDLLAIEDRLQQLQAVFRQIRNEMREHQMPSVELPLATFVFYLSTIEPLAQKYYGDFRSQVAVEAAKRMRVTKLAEMRGQK